MSVNNSVGTYGVSLRSFFSIVVVLLKTTAISFSQLSLPCLKILYIWEIKRSIKINVCLWFLFFSICSIFLRTELLNTLSTFLIGKSFSIEVSLRKSKFSFQLVTSVHALLTLKISMFIEPTFVPQVY